MTVFRRPSPSVTKESGTYTGDGSTAGRSFSLGYEPDLVEIIRTGESSVERCTAMSESSGSYKVEGGTLSTTIAMTTQVHTASDGFVVGDGGTDCNVNGETYKYVAWK